MKVFQAFVALALVGAFGSTAFAAPPGWPSAPAEATPTPALEPGEVNGGSAGFALGKDRAELGFASGSITSMEGIYIVDLTFKDAISTPDNVAQSEGKILRIGFAASEPGPATMISMLVARSGDVLSLYRASPPLDAAGVPKTKVRGNCSITITKLGAKLVEGTASCPSGMVDLDEKASPAIAAIKFKATAL